MTNPLFQTPAGKQWETIGTGQHHGICLPLSSLHSRQSCGIGEYLDLLPLIQWCHELGLDVIQLLPINDTGLGSSPYDSLSAFALNPIFLSMTHLPELGRVIDYKDKLQKIAYWSRTPRVKHHIVRELKNVFFKEYIPLVAPTLLASTEYQQFVSINKEWLEPYALFKAVKEKQYWKHWEEWPSNLKSPSQSMYVELLCTHKDAIDYHQLLQFICFQQVRQVKQFAEEHNVLLKGDIPILISRDSADVWHNRPLFFLHLAAGAPPDMYTRDGQHWGFPIYDWQALEKTDYHWWRERLKFASNLYHLYRIDHVVGFFRMWTIEMGKTPSEGTFLPSQESEWLPHGEKIMRMMLDSAPILPIGEDLGLVREDVKQTLYRLGICGTKLMRWERRWETDEGFISPADYPPLTMTTVSTHDADTLQLWWKHFPKEAKLFSEFKNWDYRPFLTLERQKEILYDSHHSNSLFHINLLQEYLALFPELVSKNPADERINIPGKVLDTNWTYRFVPNLEALISHLPLKEAIKEILA